VLHEPAEVGIGTVEDVNATGGDLTVDSNKQNILSSPVPGRFGLMGFESTKGKEDTTNGEIAVLTADRQSN